MIYLDNAASTHIKPQAVTSAMTSYMKNYASNSGRSGHKLSLYTDELIYGCREKLASLFGIANPSQIAFTPNTTTALNYAIHGYVTENDHVVISGMEHNAVLRPLNHKGASYTIAKADETGYVSEKAVEDAITNNTRLIIINHASNVTGTINPITKIGKLAKEKNIPLLVDSAQTAGVVDIDILRDNISMLAFAGHKMLYGPTGTGGLYVNENIKLKPLIQGGTGSLSQTPVQPDFMPDCLESGTLNTVGIAGLLEGVSYVLSKGTENLLSYERHLAKMIREGLSEIPEVTIYGGKDFVGVVGFNIEGIDSVLVSNILDKRYNIASRGGLHCAVLAHKSLGTLKSGVVRFSVSSFTKEEDIAMAIKAVKEISKGGSAYYKDIY